jgi:hypothetical protein
MIIYRLVVTSTHDICHAHNTRNFTSLKSTPRLYFPMKADCATRIGYLDRYFARWRAAASLLLWPEVWSMQPLLA